MSSTTIEEAPPPPPQSPPQNNSFLSEFQCQLRTSVPTTLYLLMYKIPWLISLHFVGNIGAQELAAAALATTLCNVTGMSLSVGLNSAIRTLAGQARGSVRKRKNSEQLPSQEVHKGYEYDSFIVNDDGDVDEGESEETDADPLLPITYLYRGLFIQMVIMIPMGFYWLKGVKPLLLALGQTDELSEMTEEYLRILTPGMWAYSINWTLTFWLQSIEMADVPAYAAFVGLLIHMPANIFFIYKLNWGYKGAAVATVLFQLIQPFLTCYYLWHTEHGKHRLKIAGGHTPNHFQSWRNAICSLQGICQYLALAIPGLILVSEWWATETAIFMSGRLSPDPTISLAAMTIYQGMNNFCYMFPLGASIGGATRVSNLLGESEPQKSAYAAKNCILHAGCLSVSIGLMLWHVPHTFFPSFFTSDWDVIEEASKTVPFLAFYVVADGLQNAFSGIIKGSGKQCITMPIVLFAYWVVGLPLANGITFLRNGGEMYDCNWNLFCGPAGLVAGMTFGVYVHSFLLGLVVFCMDWQKEGIKTQERLKVEMRVRGKMSLV